MEIADQALSGVESGESKPYGLCLGIFDLAHTSQDFINFLTSLRNLGHQKLREINSKVLLTPKCPAETES